MALSPNEGLKRHRTVATTTDFIVGMALSPNEGLKPVRAGALAPNVLVGMALSPNEGLKQRYTDIISSSRNLSEWR